jgi:hypothetical protein
MISYDVIGDIHGHAEKLEALLKHMGYTPQGDGYRPPADRQAVFLGDLIDRGPQQIRVLEIARNMVDAGHARCILGNHEFNAIGYLEDDPNNPGESLRPRRGDSEKARKNREQHAAFVEQVGADSKSHRDWVAWFRTLPAFLDLGGIRVVHGCWDEASVKQLMAAGWTEGSPLSDALLLEAYRPGANVRAARERLTCGLELPLPEGRFILDKSGHKHYEVRIADWRHEAKELHEVALVPAGQEAQLHGMDWPVELALSPIKGAPVLIGHHWFTGEPRTESAKLACLDWSAGKGGPLVAYRWDGEQQLSNAKLAWLPPA